MCLSPDFNIRNKKTNVTCASVRLIKAQKTHSFIEFTSSDSVLPYTHKFDDTIKCVSITQRKWE